MIVYYVLICKTIQFKEDVLYFRCHTTILFSHSNPRIVCVCDRCGGQGNRSSSEDIGSGRQGSSSEYRGASGCGSHVGLRLSRDGGLIHADPWSPPSPGVPWWCREPAEISTGGTTMIQPLNNTKVIRCLAICEKITQGYIVIQKTMVYIYSSLLFVWGKNPLFVVFSCCVKPDQSPISSLLAIISNKQSYFLLSLCFSAALFLEGASALPDSYRFLWDINILLGICLWQWHKLETWISLLRWGADLNFRFTLHLSGPL